jgi:hypothetical protein
MPMTRRRAGGGHGSDGASAPPGRKLLARAASEKPGKFSGERKVGDYVILDWDTAHGTIGLAYSLRSASSSARWLAELVYERFGEHMHEAYAGLVVPQAAANLDMAPLLQAIDVHPDCRLSDLYEITWRQLAAVLGTQVPWFHPALRDWDVISAWKPGDPPAIVPANHVERPARPLLELAADEPGGSPAAAVCLWLARHLRRQAAEDARTLIEQIRAAAADPDSDCAYVHIAAVPAPLLRDEDAEPDEMTRRAGWAQIVERRDVLATVAAGAVECWDGGEAWPVGEIEEFDPASCPAAAEWTARLRPVPPGQPPTVLERLLLKQVRHLDHVELLHDDASGCAAVRRTGRLGDVAVFACVPQRIGTLAPLSEVSLSGETAWIRTGDGGLWLAPSLPGRGLRWGSRGAGPLALASLLDRLLDDITSPPVSGCGNPPPGLLSLIQATPREGTTTYNRAQLLAARAG